MKTPNLTIAEINAITKARSQIMYSGQYTCRQENKVFTVGQLIQVLQDLPQETLVCDTDCNPMEVLLWQPQCQDVKFVSIAPNEDYDQDDNDEEADLYSCLPSDHVDYVEPLNV